MQTYRYVIGIDLGTTNTCVYACDTHSELESIFPFSIPQASGRGMVEPLRNLPSCLFIAPQKEMNDWHWQIPWDQKKRTFTVGTYAAALGEKQPERFVHSAKSWLCHDKVHRKDQILPVHADPNIDKISPLKASTYILEHIRDAWNYKYPEHLMEDQQVVITLPASFDEVARRLTIEAAKLANFKNVAFLEEPQAAFYAYLSKHEAKWKESFAAGDSILVVDVGGGTTDFSMISVEEKDGELFLERAAVGQHLLLGGDNLDLAVQQFAIEKLKSEFPTFNLSMAKRSQLKMEAQKAKEALLSGKESYTLLLEGEGSSLIGGSQTVKLQRQDVIEFILNGFFGSYSFEEALNLKKGAALKTSGLPFVQEASIVKQLASFLNESISNPEKRCPTHILFNGGTMKPQLFQDVILENLKAWFDKDIDVLQTQSLDTSVAKGACYFGNVKRGKGVPIKGGCPRAYYLLLGDDQAMTLVPRGAEASYVYAAATSFKSQTNTPLKFTVLCSHLRQGDESGLVVPVIEEEMVQLPDLYTVLEYQKKDKRQQVETIEVTLQVSLSELGVIELLLKDRDTSKEWKLDFQFGGAAVSTSKEHVSRTLSNEEIQKPVTMIENALSSRDKSQMTSLMKSLEKEIGLPRASWPPSLLRALWDAAFRLCERRKASPEYEQRWWQLVGFLLRPGVGYPLDDKRIKDLWRLLLEDTKRKLSKEASLARLISLRRIAAGFSKGQQTQLARFLLPEWTSKQMPSAIDKLSKTPYLFEEHLRLFASLERLDVLHKVKVGDYLIEKKLNEKSSKEVAWSLARLGARSLLYASLSDVIPPEKAFDWLKMVLKSSTKIEDKELVFSQIADQRAEPSVEIPSIDIKNALNLCTNEGEKDRLEKSMNNLDTRSDDQVEKLLGDQLPLGLAMQHSS